MKVALIVLGALVLAALPAQAEESKVIRVGVIGTDTSHVPAFAGLFANPKGDPDLTGFKVVAAFPAGSPDLPLSRDRVQKFADQIRDKYGVELVSSIEELLSKVDVVLLQSVDGRVHWKQAAPVLKARKPLFIDKPLTASLADALRIQTLAGETKTPVFTASSARFGQKIRDIQTDKKLGGILGCETYGSCSYLEHHPDMSFYGVHGLEMLYAFMGPGCKTVSRVATPDFDLVTGIWNDGRIGTYRGLRKGKTEFGALVFGKYGNMTASLFEGYTPMLKEVCKFYRTGQSPVSLEESVEVMAVIDAADESKRQGGAPVNLESLYQKARAEISKAGS